MRDDPCGVKMKSSLKILNLVPSTSALYSNPVKDVEDFVFFSSDHCQDKRCPLSFAHPGVHYPR